MRAVKPGLGMTVSGARPCTGFFRIQAPALTGVCHRKPGQRQTPGAEPWLINRADREG